MGVIADSFLEQIRYYWHTRREMLRYHVRVKFLFCWYDFWVGAYLDRGAGYLYVFPLPMLGVRLCFSPHMCVHSEPIGSCRECPENKWENMPMVASWRWKGPR
jgi:hypothetical protein